MKRSVWTSVFFVSVLLAGCGSGKLQPTEEEMSAGSPYGVEKHIMVTVNDGIDKFLAGEINAEGNGFYREETFYVSELPTGEEWDAYSVGDKLDLDNDGEEELILNGPYGGMYLDSFGGKVKVFAGGDGTASVLSHTECDGEMWIVHSDTTHVGRKYYKLEKYSGADNVTECIILECHEQEGDGHRWYYLNGNEVTESEYNEFYEKFFGDR